eukprot:CAMPEP_0184683060 /NCGR_PEP_ID=MMETSP0312-20130426/9785_1 /TAXON_ID=31354 /ORGANISM="Compsopogon coeruleus, Strain SAG 36.94" /LENGTH=342 /DNA_ID=CAMNT_0027135119 /DNA_START=133 /DNA_END=1161 /DNA_ORIENTATION=+
MGMNAGGDGLDAVGVKREGVVRVVCVGDVHGQWSKEDGDALSGLKPDLVLFVGDYGDEDVGCVRLAVDMVQERGWSAAFAFGNHDAWYTATPLGRKNCPYQRRKTDRVREMLNIVAERHVGYRCIPEQSLGLSVVGGRPFSWGGPYWKHPDFFREYLKVSSMEHSVLKLVRAVDSVDPGHPIIFLSHSGPTGLGNQVDDICGRDFGDKPGGDFGDEDLRQAINHAIENGKKVPLVVFGHMHKRLERGRGIRKMVAIENDTVMVNAAVVPRVVGGNRVFTVVEIDQSWLVSSVAEVWVNSYGVVQDEAVLLSRDARQGIVGKPWFWNLRDTHSAFQISYRQGL